MREIDLAWCAGFLDGEGNFGWEKGKQRHIGRFRIQACQVEREPLDRLAAALGGNVRGPYGPYSGNRKAYYQWMVYCEAAEIAFQDLKPYLCLAKVQQAEEALACGS